MSKLLWNRQVLTVLKGLMKFNRYVVRTNETLRQIVNLHLKSDIRAFLTTTPFKCKPIYSYWYPGKEIYIAKLKHIFNTLPLLGRLLAPNELHWQSISIYVEHACIEGILVWGILFGGNKISVRSTFFKRGQLVIQDQFVGGGISQKRFFRKHSSGNSKL